MGSPQPALLDDLLQRRYQRLTHRVVEVVRLLDDQVNWFTFRAHELVNPLELRGPFRVSREVPSHRSSFRYSVRVRPSSPPPPALRASGPSWRPRLPTGRGLV